MIDTSEFDEEFKKIVIKINALLQSEVSKEYEKSLRRKFREIKGGLSKDKKNQERTKFKAIKANREIILNIIKKWYVQHGAYNDIKPWEFPRSIVEIAFTGYSYGSERGQIRQISDNKYIIPLYDYGVGTYDFDLKKVQSLAKFAREKAQNHVADYFKNP